MITVWCMNLKDNRKVGRNNDPEQKFGLCIQNEFVAIGWGVKGISDDWNEYCKKSKIKYTSDRAYKAALNNIKKIKRGDLVWVKSPAEHNYYLAEITDDTPSICTMLMDYDICACRKCVFYSVENKYLIGELCPKNLIAKHTVEKRHIKPIIDATIELFDILKGN